MSVKKYYFYPIGYRSYYSGDFFTLLRLIGFANILEYQVRKVNATFPIEQNILLLYVIMRFGSFYLFKSHAWIKYMFFFFFLWKMDLRMFMVKIESYGDIFLYFCEN